MQLKTWIDLHSIVSFFSFFVHPLPPQKKEVVILLYTKTLGKYWKTTRKHWKTDIKYQKILESYLKTLEKYILEEVTCGSGIQWYCLISVLRT